jgi:outer membrane murein-binding lipoprotein Lpp
MLTNQAIMIGKIAAASRLPDTDDLRRDAMLGGVVSAMNPLAGTIVDVRAADKVSALASQVDSLKAANKKLADEKAALEQKVLRVHALATSPVRINQNRVPAAIKDLHDEITASKK